METDGKRKHPRIPVTLEMRCAGEKKPVTYVTRDLSEGGVLIASPQVFPVNSRVELQCKLPYAYGEITLSGKVVRHHQESKTGVVNGMAIEFLETSEFDRKMISDYIQNTIEKKSVG